MAGVQTSTYAESPPMIAQSDPHSSIAPFNPLRTGLRMAEQAVVNLLYGAR